MLSPFHAWLSELFPFQKDADGFHSNALLPQLLVGICRQIRDSLQWKILIVGISHILWLNPFAPHPRTGICQLSTLRSLDPNVFWAL